MSASLMTERQTAERLSTTARTLQRWRSSGEGPAYIRLGLRQIRYRVSAVDEYAAAREFRHRAEELSRSPETKTAGA